MNSKQIDRIFKIFSDDNPLPRTELEYVNNYTLLVAVVLSAQATDVGVNKATKELFKAVKTPEQMLDLGEEGLKKNIKSIGLFNSKAHNIISLSRELINKHDSEVPEDFNKLLALPGVGVKTANVVLNCAFGHPTIAVDTHVYRVARRLGLSSATKIENVAQDLTRVIPKQWQMHAHHWLILHGRYICKAQKPRCDKCKVSLFCQYFTANQNML